MDKILRYVLWRELHPDLLVPQTKGRILFVMLNPSTATEFEDDPTIRRCVIFGREWGFKEVRICNLFAYRATNPEDLVVQIKIVGADGVIGRKNDDYIREEAEKADMVVAAWGSHVSYKKTLRNTDRAKKVMAMLGAIKDVWCLEFTEKHGDPKHPLYLKSSCKPQLYWKGPNDDTRAEDVAETVSEGS